MANRVTISDVAREAGVSLMTVSRVVNNKEDVSPVTRQRVLQIIEDLGYRPSSIARGLATRRTSTLGVVVPDIDNPWFSGVVRGAEDHAYAQEYSVLLGNTNEEPEREVAVLQSLEEKQVDGLLLCSSRLSDEDLLRAVKQFPAVVLVSRILDNGCTAMVSSDDVAGGRLAAEHLLNTGHRAIGFISGPGVSYSGRSRVAGYRAALKTAGIPYREDYVCHCSPLLEVAQDTARDFLRQRPELTAVICHNDLVAVGVLHACKNLDLRVPQDMAIIGYDDIPLSALVTPALTTIRVDRYRLGAQAMQLLLEQIEANPKNAGAQHKVRNILIQPQLVIRASAP